jgi:hypothetical protein
MSQRDSTLYELFPSSSPPSIVTALDDLWTGWFFFTNPQHIESDFIADALT